MSTPTEPHHDVREEWAARLQCADVGVDFPWLTEDGCDVWHEQSEATQEHYRRLLDLALAAGLQIPPTAAVSAAAPDEREAWALAQRLDALSYGLMVGGQDNTYRSTMALGGIPDMRKAANLLRDMAALAARPAPVVSGKARTPDESCISGAAEHAGVAADDERCGWCGITPTHDPGDCAVAQRAEAQRLCDEDRSYTEAADDEGGQER